MSINLFLLLISIFLMKISKVLTQINMTAYRLMPPLYQFDDYDECLEEPQEIEFRAKGNTYCVIYAEIVRNDSSPLWEYLSNFSSDHKRHYRHDHLYFGICLRRCEDLLKSFAKFRVHELASEGAVHDIELLNYYNNVHKRPTDERVHYEKFISACVNYEFQREYGLKLRASIEYCEQAQVTLEQESLDWSVYILLGVIFLAVICSSLYDFRLKLKQPSAQQNNDFYKHPMKSNSHKFLTSFSLCRNYYRLTNDSEPRSHEDLQFFNAFRVIGVLLVIFAHTLMLFMAVPIQNPQFFEKFFYRTETALIENGTAVIQIFFIMSGFLLYLHFNQRQLVNEQTSYWNCFLVYWKVFTYRYLRLIPSLAVLLAFNATILARLQNGPFWRHYTEGERTFCREYWWKNIFFINNYLMQESCSHHTWYLAADMQLFEFFLIILILITKYPKLKAFIYGLLLFLAVAIPAGVTYFLNLKPIYHSSPESYRYMFFRHAATFYHAYTPFYTNLGGYFFGILSAELYLKGRSAALKLRGLWKYELGWWLLFPLGFALVCSGIFVMSYDSNKPSFWIALYAGLYRNLWILLCSCALLGLCFKLGWISGEFCRLPVFRPLAKLSYQAYLWHVVCLRLLGGFYRQPIYVNRLYLFFNIILVFILTNMIAFIFVLIVEYPAAQFSKILLQKFDKSKPKTTNVEEVINLR